MPSLVDIIAQGERVDGHRPWPRVVVDGGRLARTSASELAAGRATLLGLWGDSAGPRCTWRCSTRRPATIAVVSLDCPDGTFPSVGALHPPAIRLERAIRDLYGLEPVGAPDTRPWLDHGFWDVQHPLGARTAGAGRAAGLRVPAGGGREPAPDPGRPGACRHHRAGAFPLHRQRRDRRAARRAARLCAQGHRVADGRRDDRARGAARRAHLRRQHRRLCASPSRMPSRRRSASKRRRARAMAARADGRARAARQPFRRHRRHLQRRLLRADARALRHPARAGAARRRCLLRPSADDGPGRARRRRRRSSPRRRCAHPAHIAAADPRSAFPRWSSFTTTPPRCRTAPSAPASLRAELARQFGAGGYVGRASGRDFDARKTPGYAPYDELDFEVPVLTEGDVNARVWIRIREVEQSLALIEQILARPARRTDRDRARWRRRRATAKAWRLVEGFRGDVLVWVRLDGTAASRAAICAIRPGFSGRCSKRRSKATSSPTSRSATNPSTAPIRGMISERMPDTCDPASVRTLHLQGDALTMIEAAAGR